MNNTHELLVQASESEGITFDWTFELPGESVDVGVVRWLKLSNPSDGNWLNEISNETLEEIKGIKPEVLELDFKAFTPDLLMEIIAVLNLKECKKAILPRYVDNIEKEKHIWSHLINLLVMRAPKIESIDGYFEVGQALMLTSMGIEISGEGFTFEYGEGQVAMLMEMYKNGKIDLFVKNFEKREIKTKLSLRWTKNTLHIKS